MSDSRYPVLPMDLKGLSTYPLSSRKSKVSTAMFARPAVRGDSLETFVDKLPRILAAEGFLTLIDQIQQARQAGNTLLWGMGGHVIKCGLGPIIIDMMEDGLVSGIAMNGAAVIHD